MVVVNDFTAMKMSLPPKKIMESYSQSGKIAARLYPQLLQANVCCNPPTWFSMALKVGKMFSEGAKSFQKCPRKGKMSDCPFVKEYLVPEEIPSFLGGPCKCPHQNGCVPGIPNQTNSRRVLTKKEVEILKTLQDKETAEEKRQIAEFVAAYQK